jgi:hypothetical protein
MHAQIYVSMQLYEAAHRLVNQVVKKRFTNDKDSEAQILERLLLADALKQILAGGVVSWVRCVCVCVVCVCACALACWNVHACVYRMCVSAALQVVQV